MKKKLLITLVGILFFIPSLLVADVFKIYVIKSAPLAFIDASGKPAGIHYEAAKAVSKQPGIEMEVVPMNKGVIFSQIKTGKVDAGIFFPNKKWEKFTHNAGFVGEVKLIAINRKGLPLNRYEDLYQSKKIGLMPKMNFGLPFDTDKKLRKYEVRNYETQIKLLEKKRLDTITGNQIAIFYQLQKNNLSNAVELPGYVFKSLKNQFHLSKKSPHSGKLNQIQKAIEVLRKNGTFTKIVEKYVGKTK